MIEGVRNWRHLLSLKDGSRTAICSSPLPSPLHLLPCAILEWQGGVDPVLRVIKTLWICEARSQDVSKTWGQKLWKSFWSKVGYGVDDERAVRDHLILFTRRCFFSSQTIGMRWGGHEENLLDGKSGVYMTSGLLRFPISCVPSSSNSGWGDFELPVVWVVRYGSYCAENGLRSQTWRELEAEGLLSHFCSCVAANLIRSDLWPDHQFRAMGQTWSREDLKITHWAGLSASFYFYGILLGTKVSYISLHMPARLESDQDTRLSWSEASWWGYARENLRNLRRRDEWREHLLCHSSLPTWDNSDLS